MKTFYKILVLTIILCGCARKDPVETIIDNHTEHFSQTLDYAHNNMNQTSDVVFLEKELDSCVVALKSVKETHFSQIEKCEAETNYWRLATFGLFVLLGLGVLAKIKRWL